MAQAHVIPDTFPAVVPGYAETIGIAGSGPLGCALAQLAVRRGFDVKLFDKRPGQAEEALGVVATALDGLAARGRLGGGGAARIRSRLQSVSEVGEFADAALVLETSEDELDAKLAAIRALDRDLPSDVPLATQTTSFSVSRLAAAAEHPERVVGLHFLQPVAVADLVEVVRALQTSDAAYDETCRRVRALGKTIVRTEDHPGFLVHRMLIPLINEACFALQEGLASVEGIDTAARLGMNQAAGPLRMADELGLDQVLFVAERLHRELGEDKYRPAPLLKNYVAAGWLGRKARRGFHVYPRGA
jgi:3-hydroxybutyryl-CoA dehydrogenase